MSAHLKLHRIVPCACGRATRCVTPQACELAEKEMQRISWKWANWCVVLLGIAGMAIVFWPDFQEYLVGLS